MIERIESELEAFKGRLFAAAPILTAAPDLGVPQNVRLASVHFVDEHHAVITVDWDSVTDADGYDVDHEFGNMAMPGLRLIEHVSGTSIVIGGAAPFAVAPGAQYTIAVYATLGGKRAPVPAAVPIDVPPYEPPAPVPVPGEAYAPPVPYEVIQASLGEEEAAKAIIFQHEIIGPLGSEVVTFQMDTGAYTSTLALTTAQAQKLGLPTLGTSQVTGVDGTPLTVTDTQVTVPLGTAGSKTIPAIIDDSISVCLWGATLEIDDGVAFAWNPKTAKIGFFSPDNFVI